MFYVLATLSVYGALQSVLRKNPVTCALHLALSMVALSGLFFYMGAHFIAGVQLVVYAGAVMVLFVIVIMLFDTSKIVFHKETFLYLGKAILCIATVGLLSGVISSSIGFLNKVILPEVIPTKSIAFALFSNYLFLFEWMGLLLLIVAVGVVILSKGKEND